MTRSLILCGVLLGFFLATGCAPYTAAIVLRHAEKQTGPDPSLTAAGESRALALKERYDGSEIAAVYSTDFNRTKQTATPVAEAHGLPVKIYSTTAAVVADVKANYANKVVVIVGHSNTVGSIVLEFGADLPASFSDPIDDNDFDNLITVLINDNGSAGAVHATYGAPSP